MYYILRRKGNLFSKDTFIKILDEEIFSRALDRKHIIESPYNSYMGANNTEYRQWRRIPDMYLRSGAQGVIKSKPMSLTRAINLNINIPMALASGFILRRPEGLIYDNGYYRPKIKRKDNEYGFRHEIIMRKGNYYNKEIFSKIEDNVGKINKDLYEKDGELIIGLADDPLYNILTIENDTLIGVPYMLLDQLYEYKYFKYDITKQNLPDILELIVSGHVLTRGDVIQLEDTQLKRHNYYNWVGENIYCKSLT